MNRPPISPIELVFVSGFSPALLTQKFMGAPDPQTGKPQAQNKFGHRAPWFDPNQSLHPLFDCFESYSRYAWSPIGGRNVGKINFNTVWDIETFQALCDRHGAHYFTDQGVKDVWQELRYQSRTKAETPGANDSPFWGMQGHGIDDTFFRASPDPAEQAKPEPQRRRLLEPRYIPNDPSSGLRPQACSDGTQDPHPVLALELLSRIFNNITSRSNVFAVWVTVGFFEVVDDSNPGMPARLGGEIGASEGRNIRHRMFAIIDRSSLTIQPDPNTGGMAAGPPPWFIDANSSVLGNGQPEMVKVAVTSAKYEGMDWSIKPRDILVVDSGVNQETVQVTAAGIADFTAVFTKPHPNGFAISNTKLGYPGPQPRFDPRNPRYRAVVRYFSIIQ